MEKKRKHEKLGGGRGGREGGVIKFTILKIKINGDHKEFQEETSKEIKSLGT